MEMCDVICFGNETLTAFIDCHVPAMLSKGICDFAAICWG